MTAVLPAPAAASDEPAARAGGTDWKTETAILSGAASAVTLFNSKGDRWFEMTSISWGRMVTGVRGPGPLAGQLQVLVEAVPLLVMFQSRRSYGFGVNPVFLRWNFAGGGPAQLFAELSGGLLRTDRPVPEGTTRFNLIAQSGVGLRFRMSPRRALLVGYRFHHLSNGERAATNPGVNSNFVYAGVSFLR